MSRPMEPERFRLPVELNGQRGYATFLLDGRRLQVRVYDDWLSVERVRLAALLSADLAEAERRLRAAPMGREVHADDYLACVENAIIDKVELIAGHVMMGPFELVFSPAQVAAAARLGVRLPSCVDAVLADPASKAEVLHRFSEGHTGE